MRRWVSIVAASAMLGALLTVVPAALVPTSALPTAAAADLSAFDPGLIITDEVFYNSTSMSAAQIQSWLESKDGNCVTHSSGGVKYTCLADFSMKTTTRQASVNCSTYSGKASETAAQIISRVGLACGINPQVILVTLQKEQGFITGGPRSSAIYQKAMGYACPDSSTCASKYYGFFNQVFSAAWQFEQYRHYPSGRSIIAGRTNTILYHPGTACGAAHVFVRNQATAGLYIYTPYVPNSAALGAGYGSGDACSSYGNRNFYNYFTDYFGNPANLLKNASFQSGTSRWSAGSTGAVTLKGMTNAAVAQSGSRYLEVVATKADRTVQQTVTHTTHLGQVYTGGVWVRAKSAAAPVTGSLRIVTTRGTTESVSVPFTVSDTWTYVTADLAMESQGHSGFRLEVGISTPNAALDLDSSALFASGTQEQRAPLTVENTGVKSGANGGWVPSSSTLTASKGYAVGAHDGKYYLKLRSTSPTAYLTQRIPRVTATDTSYTAGMWLRSGDPAKPFSGRLKLTGMGGPVESAETDFTVGNQWTYVTTTIDIDNVNHQSLRLAVYPETLGSDLLMDDIHLNPNLYVRDSSFESGATALNPSPAGTTVTPLTAAQLAFSGSTATVPDGQGLIEIDRTTAADSYARLDRGRLLRVGQTYTVSMWVRSATPGTPYSASLSIAARASDALTESTTRQLFAGDTWQYVTVTHKVTSAGMNRLRTELHLDSPGAKILVDGVTIH